MIKGDRKPKKLEDDLDDQLPEAVEPTEKKAVKQQSVLEEIVQDVRRELRDTHVKDRLKCVDDTLPTLKSLTKGQIKKSTREAIRPRSDGLVAIRTIVIDAGHGGKDQ